MAREQPDATRSESQLRRVRGSRRAGSSLSAPLAARRVGTRESQTRKAQRWSRRTRYFGSNMSLVELRRTACASLHRERVSSTHRAPASRRWRIIRSSTPGWHRAGPRSPPQCRDGLGKTSPFDDSQRAVCARCHVASASARHCAARASRWCASARHCAASASRWCVGRSSDKCPANLTR